MALENWIVFKDDTWIDTELALRYKLFQYRRIIGGLTAQQAWDEDPIEVEYVLRMQEYENKAQERELKKKHS